MQEGQPLPTSVHKGKRLQARISTNIFRRSRRRRSPRSKSISLKLDMVFWCTEGGYVYRNHVAPRTKLHVPKDDFPISLTYIDVQRRPTTSLDVLQEAIIDDYGHMDGDKSLSEPWIGVTRFALRNQNPAEGHMWVQGRLTRKQVTT